MRFGSVEKICSGGILVSEYTLEWRLFVVSCEAINDCRLSEEFLGSVFEIDRYRPPTGCCLPNGLTWPIFEGEGEGEGEGETVGRFVVDRARVRFPSISCNNRTVLAFLCTLHTRSNCYPRSISFSRFPKSVRPHCSGSQRKNHPLAPCPLLLQTPLRC